MSKESFKQIKSAYPEIAQQARYRPAAPSDGYGNITVPEHNLNLAKETQTYAKRWWTEEDSCSYFIGCCNFPTRRATIYAVEAARQMCGGSSGDATALRLLKMAVKELESIMEHKERFEKIMKDSEYVPHITTAIAVAEKI